MSNRLSVVRPAANGKKPLAKAAPKPTLADLADDLYELRTLLKKSTEAERKLTAEVLEGMRRVGADRIEGAIGVAILGEREMLAVDPALFLEATGSRGYGALVVRLEPARELLGESDLRAIANATVTPTLRVVPKPEAVR